ncbi:MAG: 4Fe-4S binding protein [Firmicutes bacterium]|nr:4Fe-4S binding protein [Bacillota bacterium]
MTRGLTTRDVTSRDNKVFEGLVTEAPKGSWTIFPELCKGCGLCIEKCPTDAIRWSTELGAYGSPRVESDMEKCIVCNICAQICPDCAISVKRGPKDPEKSN